MSQSPRDSLPAPLPNETASSPFVVGLALALGLLVGWMVGKLLVGVVGGLVLWAMTGWIHRPLLRLVRGRRGPAAALSVAATVLLLVVPLAGILYLALLDASHLVDSFRSWLEPYRPEIERRLAQLTRGRGLRVLGLTLTLEDITGALDRAGAAALAVVRRVTGGVLDAALLVGVILYSQFFFFLDANRFLGWLRRVLPLTPLQSGLLLEDFFATSRSTIRAFGILGVLQGGLGGAAFYLLDIPAPFFWTVVMALSAAVPAVGAQLVLVPAAITLVLIGRTGAGIALLAFSWIVIASVDNLLRPVLVRRDAELHEVVVLVSTIGGIATFGLVGVLLGPVLAALFKSSLDIYAASRPR